MDEPLADYFREQWPELVRYAAVLRTDPDGAEAVLATSVTNAAAGWRRRPTPADPDSFVRRVLIRACIEDGKRAADAFEVGQRVDVAFAGELVDGVGHSEPPDLVREAVAGLLSRQRAALVLHYVDGLDDEAAAGLMGCSISAFQALLTRGLGVLEDLLAVDAFGSVTGDGSSRTEGLLRAMLADLPAPAVTITDPPAALEARIERLRRRRLLTAAAAAVVVVVVAIVAVVSGSGGGQTPPPSPTDFGRTQPVFVRSPQPPEPVVLPSVSSAYPMALAIGDGSLWVLELHPSARHPGSFIERRNLTTGQPEQVYAVPGEDFFLAYGVGRVWAWGIAAEPPDSMTLSSLNPTTGGIRQVRVSAGVGLQSVAFADGSAWFTEPAQDRVMLVRHGREVGTTDVPHPEYAVAVSKGSILTSSATGRLLDLPSRQPADTEEALPTLLSPAPGFGIWAAHGRLVDFQASVEVPPIVQLRLPGTVSAVVGDPVRGAYVAVRTNRPRDDAVYLAYYSASSATSRLPSPSATLRGHVRIESMAEAPDGKVVFVTSDGAIETWNGSVAK